MLGGNLRYCLPPTAQEALRKYMADLPSGTIPESILALFQQNAEEAEAKLVHETRHLAGLAGAAPVSTKCIHHLIQFPLAYGWERTPDRVRCLYKTFPKVV